MYSPSDLWTLNKVLSKPSRDPSRKATIMLHDDGKNQRAIKKKLMNYVDSLQTEENYLNQIQSPFVITCYGHEVTFDRVMENYNIILNYCEGGALSQKCHPSHLLPEIYVKELSRDILTGLSVFNATGIVHYDINPINILMYEVRSRTWRHNGYTAIIADLESAMEIVSTGYPDRPAHITCNLFYQAPELQHMPREREISSKLDIWSFEITLMEMLIGSFKRKDMLRTLPGKVVDLIILCSRDNPSRRPTSNVLLQHPFLQY